MKILTNKEYLELVKSKEKLEKQDINEKTLKNEIESLQKKVKEYTDSETQQIKNIKRDCENCILDKEADFKIRTASLETRISQETNKRVVAEEKSKMLEVAFKNLGFDVKDSKYMMSELIKALGVKNTVQVIK